MTLPIESGGAAVLVDSVQSGYGSIDFEIPHGDISYYRGGVRAGNAMGEGELTLDNQDYQYSSLDSATELKTGDKLIIVADLPPSDTGFGKRAFGEGPFGESVYTQFDLLGTYRVLDWDIIEYAPGESDMTITLGEFVHDILQSSPPVFYGTYDGPQPLAGTDDAILNEILDEFFPQIDTRLLPVIEDEYEYYSAGNDGATVVDEIAKLAADAGTPVIQTAEQSALVFDPIYDSDSREDIPDQAFGQFGSSSESHDLANWVRVDGGIDDEGNIEADSQESVSSYQLATNEDRLITQVETRKSQISTVELYTRGQRSTLSNNIRIRFQEPNTAGTGPIDVEDYDSDIVDSGGEDITETTDGWRAFAMPENTNRERNPWMIIESDTDPGHRVGVNGAGRPAYRIHYPKPVVVVLGDGRSQRRYGVYGNHIRDESLASADAARARARAELERNAWPDIGLGPVECVEPTAHDLVVGDTIRFDRPGHKVRGEYVVTQKDDTYDQNQLKSTVEFTEVDNYV